VRRAVRARRYDLVILVDYPGYHLRVAAEAAAAGIPVLYYIAPQMWAWAPGRVRKLAAVRRLAVILPFEEAFFRERGVAAADAGPCKSGTARLEAALADGPRVIAYRLNPVSFAIASRMLQVPHVGLVNLIAGREVSPELLQGAVTPAALADAVLPLLDP